MTVCLVLGAGATLAQALAQRKGRPRPPLDATFFEIVRRRRLTLGPALRAFAQAQAGGRDVEGYLATVGMETFFRALYADLRSHPGDQMLQHAYRRLVQIYAEVIAETTDWLAAPARHAPLGDLLSAAAGHADEVVVISFNQDLVTEYQLARRADDASDPLARRWCLTRGYGELSRSLTLARPDDPYAAPEPIELFEPHSRTCDHRRPVKLLKLHGSLNWFAPGGGVLGAVTGGARRPRLLLNPERRVFVPAIEPTTLVTDRGRRVASEPFVIPPIYDKHAPQRLLKAAWDEAETALGSAERVVFVGYSIPALDSEAERLFQRAIAANPVLRGVDLVDPSPAAAQRYAEVLPDRALHRYPRLDSFLASGGLT